MKALLKGRTNTEWLLYVWAWQVGCGVGLAVLGLPTWIILYLIYRALT